MIRERISFLDIIYAALHFSVFFNWIHLEKYAADATQQLKMGLPDFGHESLALIAMKSRITLSPSPVKATLEVILSFGWELFPVSQIILRTCFLLMSTVLKPLQSYLGNHKNDKKQKTIANANGEAYFDYQQHL